MSAVRKGISPTAEFFCPLPDGLCCGGSADWLGIFWLLINCRCGGTLGIRLLPLLDQLSLNKKTDSSSAEDVPLQ